MPNDAEIIIDIDAETEKIDKKIDKVLKEYSEKKIELDLQLKDQSLLKRQLKELDNQIKSLNKPAPNLINLFNDINDELKRSISNTTILREQIKFLYREYTSLFKEQLKLQAFNFTFGKFMPSKQLAGLLPEKATKMYVDIIPNTEKLEDNLKTYFSRLGGAIRNSFSSFSSGFVSKFSNIASTASNTFERIIGSFKNFNAHALNSSRHVDYFSRRIFNLLRNAFVFNVISRQFRGLSSLLGNLVHRDIYFAKSLMIVKANLVRAFAPIWQIILPWIRALGDGLVWISNQLIRFINFLTGSKIKPLQGFQEAKQVVDDFKRIASPTRDLFDLKDPDKQARELKKNIKDTQDESYRTAKNAERLAKRLKASQQQSTKLLAKFDKLEVLKFKKVKNPLDDISNVSKNKGLNIPINLPSIEDQIDNAINNIKDKPLKFNVGSDLGENITSEINGLKLKALDFEVDEDSTNALNNFKKKMMDFWNWISPLVESIKNLFKGLSESFKRLFDDLNENGTFKMVVGWFTEWKDNLTNFFNTISQNKEQMDTLRNFIIGIGVAFVTYQIISKISSLVSGITQITTLLTTSPLGWLVLAAGVFTILSLKAGTFKEDLENVKNKISGIINFAVKLSQKLGEAISDFLNSEAISNLKEVFGLVFRPIGAFLKWLTQNDTALTILADGILAIGSALATALIAKKIADIANAAVKLLAIFDFTNPVGWVALAIGGLVLIVRHWDKIKETAENVFNAIKDAGNNFVKWIDDVLSKSFGGLYDIIKKVFGFIGKIGSFIGNPFDLSSMFNQLGGSNQSTVPGLAQGSVLKGGDPFLAYLNDQPRGQTNIEAPLSTIVDAFKQAINESNYNNQPDITINASGDMSSFIRMLNFRLQDENNRLGGSFVDTSSF